MNEKITKNRIFKINIRIKYSQNLGYNLDLDITKTWIEF